MIKAFPLCPKYSVTTDGKVFKHGRELLQHEVSGYKRVTLFIHGKRHIYRVHRMVALTFLNCNDSNKIEVNHKDGNKSNNNVENLEWVSNAENISHAKMNGLLKARRGEECSNSILTEDMVLKIFNDHRSIRDLSVVYGISAGTISSIKTGKNWGWLTGKEYKRKDVRKVSLTDEMDIFKSSERTSFLAKKYGISKSSVSRIRKKYAPTSSPDQF